MLVLGATSIVQAQDCPEPPANLAQRRTMAREWFSRAEGLERSGDDVAAVRSYQCSIALVPHASTTYNLARVAEKTGDLEQSLASYRNYLTLRPDAPDRAAVEERITNLESRIAAVRTGANQPAPPPPLPRAEARTPAPMPAPAPASPQVDMRSSPEPQPSGMGAAPWIVGGIGVAALAVGIALNVTARGKMADCRSLATTDKAGAQSACDSAKPLAYASYALFGAAAVAAAIDVGLIWSRSSRGSEVAFTPLPGGGALALSSRF